MKWTPEMIATLRQRVELGDSDKIIARLLGVSYRGIIGKRRRIGLLKGSAKDMNKVWVVGHSYEAICWHSERKEAVREALRRLNEQHAGKSRMFEGTPRFQFQEVEGMAHHVTVREMSNWRFE